MSIQNAQVNCGCDFIEVVIGGKRFYASHDNIWDFAKMFSNVLKELGYEVELEERY